MRRSSKRPGDPGAANGPSKPAWFFADVAAIELDELQSRVAAMTPHDEIRYLTRGPF